MNRKIQSNQYFLWLCGQIRNRSHTRYRKLLDALHLRQFYWSVPNDDNRLEDGLRLRDIFVNSHPSFLPPDPRDPCSMLEMLVALAGRMEDELADPQKGNRISHRFWEMIHNIGLDQFDDDDFDEAMDNSVIDYILNRLVNRTYDRRGNGSLFPCKRYGRNLAKVEIWYQMQQYLHENYAE